MKTITTEMQNAAKIISNTNMLTATEDQKAKYWDSKVLVEGYDVRNGELFLRVPAFDKSKNR